MNVERLGWLKKPASILIIVALLVQATVYLFISDVSEARAIEYSSPGLATFVTAEQAPGIGAGNNVINVAGIEGLAIGDVLIACVTSDKDSDGSSSNTLGWPTGFTPVINAVTTVNDDIASLMAYKVVDATSTEGSYNFSYPDLDADFSVVLGAFRGVDTIDPFDASSTSLGDGAGWSDTTDPNPAVTTSASNALIVACTHHSLGSITGYTAPSGMTMVTERKSSGENTAMAYGVQTAAGSSGTKQFTTAGENTGEEWHLNTAAFNAQQSFSYKDKAQFPGATSTTWVVPSQVFEIEVKAWGAGGGGGQADSNAETVSGGHGGGGAFVYGRIAVTPGETLGIEVGSGGGVGSNDTNAGDGGGGGGHTEITRNGQVLIIAGAGGGGGGSSDDSSEDGGDGGVGGADQGVAGDNEAGGASAVGGQGGHQSGGGSGYAGQDGSSQAGGDGQGGPSACGGSNFGGGGAGGSTSGGDGGDLYNTGSCGGGGGGGSGYFGGEGGESDNTGNAGGGGGGGSSWASSTAVFEVVKRTGNGKRVGGAYDFDLRSSQYPAAGMGGMGDNRQTNSYTQTGETNHVATTGNNGLLIIKYRTLFQPSGQTTFTRDVDITGNAQVTRNIAKAKGTFAIDHPLDPENKILYHSFVESPDVMNMYDGIATLDWNGEAVVALPNYFEALNTDFRYQFSPIGVPMPELHVEQTVHKNRFKLAGGVPGARVAWQVTGIRNDPYIKANPIVTEVDKSPEAIVDKGEFLFKGYEEKYED